MEKKNQIEFLLMEILKSMMRKLKKKIKIQ